MTVISKTLYFVYLIENDKARIIPSTKPIHIPTMNARMIVDVNLSTSRLLKSLSPKRVVCKKLLAGDSKGSLLTAGKDNFTSLFVIKPENWPTDVLSHISNLICQERRLS